MKTDKQQMHQSRATTRRGWQSSLGCVAAAAICLGLASPGTANAEDESLGMLSRLPADTEAYVGFHGMTSHLKAMMASNIGKTILGVARKENGGVLPWEENEDAGMALSLADSIFGKEIFIAFGKGTSKQGANLLSVIELLQEAQLQEMERSWRGLGIDQVGGEPWERFFNKNAGKILDVLERAEIPPMIIGFKMGDMRDTILQQIDAVEGQLPEVIEISSIPIPEVGRFKSWTLEGKALLGPDQKQQIDKAVGPKHGHRVAKILADKKIEVCHGIVDGYMLISVGTDHKHLRLVKNPADSLLAVKEFQQLKPYFGKRVFNVSYASEALQKSFYMGDPVSQLLRMAESFAKNANLLKDSSVLTKGVESLLEQGKKLFAYNTSTYAGIMMWDEGLRFESVGGASAPSIDMDANLDFLPLIDDSTFLSMNGAADPEYNAAIFQYLETLVNTAIDSADQLVENQETAEFKKGLARARSEFFGPGSEIYKAIKGMALDGLGAEQAVLVDFGGDMPKIPNTPLPTVMFKKGKIPRLAIVHKVKNRKAVSDAWDKLVPAVTQVLDKIPTNNGQGIPFPDFLSTEKNGLTTYFYPFPFTSNNCLPSVSISDDLFFLSTSKEFSESIAAKMKSPPAGGERRTGWQVWVNFEPVRKVARDWMKLAEENIETITRGNENDMNQYRQMRPLIDMGMEMSETLRSIKLGSYKDGEWLRTSMHFKMRDFPRVMDFK